MSKPKNLYLAALFGVVVAVVAAAGIGVRATHGAQTTADEPQYLLSAISLWEDGDLDISDELGDERYREFHEADLPTQTLLLEDGRRISPHDPLLPLLLALPVGIGGWIAGKATLALLGGALAALTAWTVHTRFGVSRATAYVTTGLFAVSPPLVIYSTQVYPEVPAALVLLAGLTAILGRFERSGRLIFVAAVIALPWLAIKYVPVAVVLAVAGLIRAGRGHRRALVLTLAGPAAIYVLGHLAIYDGLTAYATGDHFIGGEFTAVGSDVNLWGRSTRLIGLLVDRGFGIAAWQPAFLLLPLVAGWALTRRRRGFTQALWLLGVGWLVATFVALTMHGWWFPGRQVVVVLPVAVLLIAVWVDGSKRSRLWKLMVPGSLGVLAFGFLVVEGLGRDLTWVVDFGATVNPAYRALAVVLPDYMAPTVTTWVLHGWWVVVAAALGWLGWRGGSTGEARPLELRRESNQERVLT